MKSKHQLSHHWPNVISHLIIGITSIGLLAAMVIGAFLSIKSEGIWIHPLWFAILAGIVLIPFASILMLAEPFGYLKEINLDDEYLHGTHIFGMAIRLHFKDISKCSKVTTTSESGLGNPAIVIRANKFPFRLVFNMKGFSHRNAEIVYEAINYRMSKARKKGKRGAPSA
jgi:hypothetical protein